MSSIHSSALSVSKHQPSLSSPQEALSERTAWAVKPGGHFPSSNLPIELSERIISFLDFPEALVGIFQASKKLHNLLISQINMRRQFSKSKFSKALDLSRFQNITNTTLRNLQCLSIKELRIAGYLKPSEPFLFKSQINTTITDDGLAELRELPLTSLEISFCTRINGKSLKLFTGLRVLKTVGCKNLEIEQLGTLNTRTLEELKLWGSPKGPVQRLGIHLRSFIFLKVLDLGQNFLINDETISQLAFHPRLEILSLGGDNITDDGIQQLATIPTLLRVNFLYCEQITHEGVERLKEATHERLKIIRLHKEAMKIDHSKALWRF